MEIHLDSRAVKQIRVSAAEAIEEGDQEALQEDILEAIPEEAVEELDIRLGAGDFAEFLAEILGEWSGDDIDELFELLETHFGDQGVDLKYAAPEYVESDDDDDFGDADDEFGTTVPLEEEEM